MMNQFADIKKLRAEFPILDKEVNGKPLVYFDNAATTQKPESVLRGILAFYTSSNLIFIVEYTFLVKRPVTCGRRPESG